MVNGIDKPLKLDYIVYIGAIAKQLILVSVKKFLSGGLAVTTQTYPTFLFVSKTTVNVETLKII